MDSRGRLFVGDRANNRIQIFDQTASCSTSGRSSAGRAASTSTRTTCIYVADSESESVCAQSRRLEARHPHRQREGRQGPSFIPDPVEKATGTSAAEGVAVDAQGNIYGAEVGPRALKKYVRK